MAETTTHDEEMTRAELASFLRSVADEFDSGDAKARIQVGNKEVLVSPSDAIDSEVTVTERSRRLRKDTEELALTFKWNPTKDTAEADSEAEGESASAPEDDGLDADR